MNDKVETQTEELVEFGEVSEETKGGFFGFFDGGFGYYRG